MMSKETSEKLEKIADILRGSSFEDMLTILGNLLAVSFIEVYGNNDIAVKKMHSYFEAIETVFKGRQEVSKNE